uniref:ribonuclease P n=1 Tax=Strigamia maritima TaxID=126957 RepID=T1IIL0_STRMM
MKKFFATASRLKKGDFIHKLIEEKKFYTLHEWYKIKSIVIRDAGISETGFAGYIMKILHRDNNLIGAKSLIEFLDVEKTQPTPKLLTQFLQMCAESATGDQIVYNSYEKLRELYPSYVAMTDFCSVALSNTNHWHEMINLLEKFEELGRPPTRRYDLLVQTAFAKGEIDVGLAVLERMAREKRFPSCRTVHEWLEVCELDESKMNDFLDYLQNTRMTLTSELAEKVRNYFEMKGFDAKYVSMQTHFGYCSNCKTNLQKLSLDQAEFKFLSNTILAMVKNGENKFLKCEFELELHDFAGLMARTAPYDIILDATSIGVGGDLSSLVEHLIRKEKNVLIIGKKRLKLKESIKNKCQVFITQSLWPDDPFILYAAFSSGWGASVVSRNVWANSSYVFRGKDQLLELFAKWRTCKQVPFRVDGQIELLEPRNVNPVFQRTDLGMHIPLTSKPNTDIVNSLKSPTTNKKAKLAEEIATEPKINEKPTEISKTDQFASVVAFLQSKGPFYDEVSSLLSQFKRLYLNKIHNTELNLPEIVEFYLKKCDFTFKWNTNTEKSQLIVEEFLISEGTTKEMACDKLIKLILDSKSNLKHCKPKHPLFVRLVPPITQAKDVDILKLLPSLIAFKSAFFDFKAETDNLITKIYSCAKTSGLRVKQHVTFDRVEKSTKCVIDLNGFAVCSGTEQNKNKARAQALHGFMSEIEKLIEKGNGIDASSVDEAELKNGVDLVCEPVLCAADFVLFDGVGTDAGKVLNYSAEMSNASLVFKVYKGVSTMSLGSDFVAAVKCQGEEPFGSLVQVVLEKLKRRCYTIVVKKTFPDIEIKRDDVLSESEVDIARVKEILKEFSESYKMQSVVLSTNFSATERESICSVAKSLFLKITEDSIVTVKKRKPIESFASYLLTNGGSVDGYELIPPQK